MYSRASPCPLVEYSTATHVQRLSPKGCVNGIATFAALFTP